MVACVAGGILVPGVLSWRRSRREGFQNNTALPSKSHQLRRLRKWQNFARKGPRPEKGRKEKKPTGKENL